MKLIKVNVGKRMCRYLFIFLMESFNRFPRFFRSWFSRRYSDVRIDKTASIAGLPIFLFKVRIGKYTLLNGDAYLENVDIGKYCCIGRDLRVFSGNHDMTNFTTFGVCCRNAKSPFTNYDIVGEFPKSAPLKMTVIGNDVWIGSFVGIKGGVNIGTGAVIGAYSMVTKDVPPYAIVAGNPARIIRYRFDEDKISRLLQSEWWNYSPEKLAEEWDNLNK